MTNKYSDYTNEKLDREVAERVLGWRQREAFGPFATSMDACLEHIIPAMDKLGFEYEQHISDVSKCSEARKRHKAIFKDVGRMGEGLNDDEFDRYIGDTSFDFDEWLCELKSDKVDLKLAARVTCIAALLTLDAMENK